MKTAFITGITGQDGSYLASMLLHFGYKVHGLARPNNSTDRNAIHEKLKEQGVILHFADICDSLVLHEILSCVRPDEVYHLAAQSHVRLSFDLAEYTQRINSSGTSAILTALMMIGDKNIKFYNAATSELFGNSLAPQDELSKFDPLSPYAISKLAAYYSVDNFKYHGYFGVSGILFNHESPHRGPQFVTRKIAIQVAEIVSGRRSEFSLGNMSAKRDWGYAPEYVYAMWKMLQQDDPDNFVIGTGETHSILEYLGVAATYVGISDWKKMIREDITQFRPVEVNLLQANPQKALSELGWTSQIKFKDLVHIMVDFELRNHGIPCPGAGIDAIKRLSKQSGYSWIPQAEGL